MQQCSRRKTPHVWFKKVHKQDAGVVIILPINHHQIIQQLRKIIIVETKCESTFYEILVTYTVAIVIGLRNHKVVKFYKILNVLLRFMVKYDFMV